MASLRKAKKKAKKEGRVFNPSNVKAELLDRARKSIEETNKRLRSLDRAGEYNTFASKKLFERLGSGKLNILKKARKINRGKVLGLKLNLGLNNTDLTAIIKATAQFLKSATSTTKGINIVAEKTKKSMYETLKIQGKDITMQDIEDYYDMLGDRDFDYFNDKVGASEMWVVIEDAVEHEDSATRFLKRLNDMSIIDAMTDQDAKERALRLYTKYVL